MDEIRSVISAFESTELPLENWHHREHLIIAWHYLRTLPLQAEQLIREGIQRYNAAKGILTTPTGWIDGQARAQDEYFSLRKFTPRAKRSIWSKINRESALALIANGEIMPAGLAEVERARADGRWDQAYDSPKAATVPVDLQAALSANPEAEAFFKTLTSQNRYAILFRIQTVKKAETRARRIAAAVEMLARHETFHP